MPLINVTADFSRVVAVLEDISLTLKHGIRILEATFPVRPAEQWSVRPAETLHVVDDAALLEREQEEERKRKQAPEPEAPNLSLEDIYNLDPDL